MLRRVCAAVTAASFASFAIGGSTASTKELHQLVDSLPMLPPELAADAMLRLVENGQIADRQWRISTLEEAYGLAGSAKCPFPVVGATSAALDTDSDAGIRQIALSAKIDQLSLRCRVVNQMLESNPSKAVELFRQIPPLEMPRLVCTHASRALPDIYYQTASQVFERGFASQKAKGLHLEFAESCICSISSPTELEPALRIILDQRLDPDGFSALITAFGAALRTLNTDDRTFTAIAGSGLVNIMVKAAESCRNHDIAPGPVVEALRQFLVRHLNGVRCAESGTEAGWQQTAKLLDSFSASFAQIGVEVPPIELSADRPPATADSAAVLWFWISPDDRKLMRDYKHLRFGGESDKALTTPRTDRMAPYLGSDQRSTDQWKAELLDFLSELWEWQKDKDANEPAYFHQAGLMYRGLLVITPAPESRRAVLNDYVKLLRNNVLERESPPDWYLEFTRLVRHGMEIDEHGQPLPGQVQPLDVVHAQGDGIMATLAAVEALIPNRDEPRK